MPPESNFRSDSDRDSDFSIKEVQLKPRRNSTGPKYFCNFCDSNFKRLDHLDRHVFKHTGVKKHACTYENCDKVYSILTHLKRHILSKHEHTQTQKEKDVKCTIKECGKMFQTQCSMQKHIREVHENPKVYTCLYCTEKFTQKLKMRRHEITKHTGEYPFNCEKCDKGFYQQWHYEKHIPSCKVYFCPNCSEQFDKWTSYRKHCKEKQHGRKYYQCEHCTRMYARPGELQRHVVMKHSVEEIPMSFKCTHEGCARVYAYERNLRQHVKMAHIGKRFECQEKDCQRCFSSAQNLAKHLNREHLKRKQEYGSKYNTSDQIKNTKGKRRKRKDAGMSVVSNLACLTGIVVERQFDKLLRLREPDALAAVSAELTKSMEEEEQKLSDIDSNSQPEKTIGATKQQAHAVQQAKTVLPQKCTGFSPQLNEETELNDMLELVLQD